MRRFVTAFAWGALLLGGFTAMAAETSLTGEVVDVQCAAKRAEKGKGTDHASCAVKCAKNGAKLGIATADGVYVITGDMTKDNNAKLVEFVAKQVDVKGEVGEAEGQKTINVATIAAAQK